LDSDCSDANGSNCYRVPCVTGHTLTVELHSVQEVQATLPQGPANTQTEL